MAREGAIPTFREYSKQATGGSISVGLIRDELHRLALYDREWRVTVVVPIIHGRPAWHDVLIVLSEVSAGYTKWAPLNSSYLVVAGISKISPFTNLLYRFRLTAKPHHLPLVNRLVLEFVELQTKPTLEPLPMLEQKFLNSKYSTTSLVWISNGLTWTFRHPEAVTSWSDISQKVRLREVKYNTYFAH